MAKKGREKTDKGLVVDVIAKIARKRGIKLTRSNIITRSQNTRMLKHTNTTLDELIDYLAAIKQRDVAPKKAALPETVKVIPDTESRIITDPQSGKRYYVQELKPGQEPV